MNDNDDDEANCCNTEQNYSSLSCVFCIFQLQENQLLCDSKDGGTKWCSSIRIVLEYFHGRIFKSNFCNESQPQLLGSVSKNLTGRPFQSQYRPCCSRLFTGQMPSCHTTKARFTFAATKNQPQIQWHDYCIGTLQCKWSSTCTK